MENGRNRGIAPFESVAKAWPKLREAVLKYGMKVDSGDVAGEVSEALDGADDAADKPYVLERKVTLPGMMRLGGPRVPAALPQPVRGDMRNTRDRIEVDPLEDDDNSDFVVSPYQIPSPMKPEFTGPDWDARL